MGKNVEEIQLNFNNERKHKFKLIQEKYKNYKNLIVI